MSPGLHVKLTPREEAGDAEETPPKLPMNTRFDRRADLCQRLSESGGNEGTVRQKREFGYIISRLVGRDDECQVFHTRHQQCGSRPAACTAKFNTVARYISVKKFQNKSTLLNYCSHWFDTVNYSITNLRQGID